MHGTIDKSCKNSNQSMVSLHWGDCFLTLCSAFGSQFLDPGPHDHVDLVVTPQLVDRRPGNDLALLVEKPRNHLFALLIMCARVPCEVTWSFFPVALWTSTTR